MVQAGRRGADWHGVVSFGVNSKVITVINRSEVVGRPLAALLANDGARVLSVDIDCE